MQDLDTLRAALYNPVGRPRKYRFAEMQAGEHEFHPLIDGTIRDLQNRLKTSAEKYGRFTTQRVVSKGALGVRVRKETK